MNDESIESQMLDALELLHYARRFRKERFSVVLGPEAQLSRLILDLRLLQAAGIEVVLFCSSSHDLRGSIEGTTKRGAEFTPVKSVDAKSKEAVDHIIGTGSTPVVFLRSGKTLEELLAQNDLFELSRQLGARRTILVSPYPGLMLGEHLSSHPTEQDIRKALHEDTPCNVSRRLLELIVAELSEAETEIILLGDAPGDLYQEIFTHRGCGTLFTHSYPNVIRTAKLSDTHQIALLLRPTVQNASVLPVSEDQIAEHISQFSVYTVNSQIVALAKLTPYGSAVELGKFATLPRYQGKGRARELALYLLEKAKRKSFRSVFALSMNPVMWKFFEHLGFSETSRDKLPEEWSKQYDHSRPSKAFWLDFPVRKSRPVQSAQSPSAS